MFGVWFGLVFDISNHCVAKAGLPPSHYEIQAGHQLEMILLPQPPTYNGWKHTLPSPGMNHLKAHSDVDTRRGEWIQEGSAAVTQGILVSARTCQDGWL